MTILKNNLKRIFGKKINIIFMLVIPIIVNIFIVSISTQNAKYNLGILDNDDTKFTQEFISTFKENNNIAMLSNDDDIENMVLKSEIDCAFVIDAGFTNDMISGKDVKIKSYALDGTNQTEPIEIGVSSYLSSAKNIAKASNGDENTFYEGIDQYSKSKYIAEYKNFASSYKEDIETAVASLGYMAFAMLFLIIFSTSLLLDDKLSGVFDRTSTTPIRPSSYYIQHLLSYFIVAVIQVIVVINILPKVVNINYGNTIQEVLKVIAISCIFALVCISIGLSINRFSKNSLTAGALNTLISLPMLMLGGCLWPKDVMPDFMQRIGDFMPTSWYLTAAESVIGGGSIWNVKNEILYMLGFVMVLFVVAFSIRTEKVK